MDGKMFRWIKFVPPVALALLLLVLSVHLAGSASTTVTQATCSIGATGMANPANCGLAGWSPSSWMLLAVVVLLIVVLASVGGYMLALVMGSTMAAQWARRQVYEALISLAMIIVFFALAGLMFLNPVKAMQGVGLAPPSCNGTSSALTTPTNMYMLAACNLQLFNNNALGVFSSLIWFNTFLMFGVELKLTLSPMGQTTPDFNIATTFSPIPSTGTNTTGFLMEILLAAVLLDQFQLVLVSGSILFLFVLITLGLIARTFGFSRSFGGTLIALGLGLGLLYPMMVALTYGFVNTQVNSAGTALASDSLTALGAASGATFASSLMSGGLINPASLGTFMLYAENAAVSVVTSGNSAATSVANIPGDLIRLISTFIVGLTFIPVLNLLILGAFVSDLSSAIGERVNLLSMLTGFI